MKKRDPRKEKIVKEILFELGFPEAKFLIAVCDRTPTAGKIIQTLNDKLLKKGKKSFSISIPVLPFPLVHLLIRAVRDAGADVVHLMDIGAVPKKDLPRFFSELNFQRDALSGLGLPIVLWISKSQIQQLASAAPDLWSRRHGVYSFDVTSVENLLTKIFSQRPNAGDTGHPNRDVARAVTDILAAERELRGCLQHRSQFSLGKADDLIQRIRKGVDQLETAGRKGKKIEIAMWLWNMSRLDQDLQQAVRSAETTQKGFFETLYTDRNEVLLHMAENIVSILTEYSEELEAKIRSKARVSILMSYVGAASKKLAEMASVLTVDHVDLEDLAEEATDATLYEHSMGWANDEFRATAAHQLELWLSGLNIDRPRMFSASEGKILKGLYEEQGRQNLAVRLGLSPEDLNTKITDLEEKVRLFLGFTPTSPGAPS
jgi:hypothetical protein